MTFNLRHTLIFLGACSALFSPAQGGFPVQFLFPLNPPPEGVTLVDDGTGNADGTIIVNENLPSEADAVLYLVEIQVTGPEALTIAATTPNKPAFQVEYLSSTWNLKLNSSLDYEDRDSYLIRLEHNGNFRSVLVNVGDINDIRVQIINNPESLLTNPYDELVDPPSPNQNITWVEATDEDKIDVGKLTYDFEHIIGDDGTPTFEMDATGRLFIIRALNYRTAPMHRLILRVFDSDRIHNYTVPITIEVRDVPNEPPEFIRLPPSLNVPENSAVNSVVATIQARDQDLAVNWPILYSAVEHHENVDTPQLFSINETSGELRVLRDLDAEKLFYLEETLIFDVSITATENKPDGVEGEELSITERISINIQDLDDRAPEVCTILDPSLDPDAPVDCLSEQSYVVSIPETHTEVLPLGVFVVRDLDPTFSFSQYDIGFAATTDTCITDAFRIQPGSGSNITEYSIAVNISNPGALDYDDQTRACWYVVEDGVPSAKVHNFEIVITGKSDPTKKATAKIRLTVTDVNDNSPIFENIGNNEYEFQVCEETEPGTVLNTLNPINAPDRSLCRGWTDSGTPLRVEATDADISPQFKDITYKWSISSRTPPVAVHETQGTMTLDLSGEDARNFDYERVPVEYFTIEASDGVGSEARVSRVDVKFAVLDRNEAGSLDLRLPMSQVSVLENSTIEENIVLAGIVINSTDLRPNVVVGISWDEARLFMNEEEVRFQDPDPIDTIKQWFIFQIVDATNPRSVQATLFVNPDIEINRELTSAGVDRVDLVLTAKDTIEEVGGNSTVFQTLIVRIVDINDNYPVWEDITDGQVSRQILETEPFAPGEDNSTQSQREIYTFRVRDSDLDSKFGFKLSAPDCGAGPEICAEYLALVNLTSDISGKAVLSRTFNQGIDREETKFFDGNPTDLLTYTVTVCDTVEEDGITCSLSGNKDSVQILIAVEDRNDNIPEWKADGVHPTLNVNELATPGSVIATYQATDKDRDDRFGKITYILTDTTDNAKFAIDGTSGALSVLGPFDWSTQSVYTITIEAIDNYRPNIPTDSNFIQTTTQITILDENNHPPEFRTEDEPLAAVPETWPQIGQPLNETVAMFDKDNPTLGNGQYDVTITKILKDGVDLPQTEWPFRAGPLRDGDSGEKLVPIVVLKDLKGQWANYGVTFEAVDKGDQPLSQERTYIIRIVDENLNSPIFVFPSPDNETSIMISVDSIVDAPISDWNGDLLNPCLALDADDSSTNNSVVRYKTVQEENDPDDGFEYFRVTEFGRIELAQELDNSRALHHLYIIAEDQGTPSRSSEVVKMRFLLRSNTNRPPLFNDTTPLNITLPENIIGALHNLLPAFDPDPTIPGIEEDVIHYHIVGGSKEYFAPKLSTIPENGELIPYLTTIEPLDREFIKLHQLVIYTSNDETPPPTDTDPGQIPTTGAYLLINIEVENEFDTYPQFPQVEEGGVISGGFALINPPNSVITLIPVIDLDDNDFINFTLSQNFIASHPSLESVADRPFILGVNERDPNRTTELRLNFAPQPSMTGHFTFNITATDLGLLSSTVQCKMYMIKEENVVQFKFLNRVEEIEEKKSGLADALSFAFAYRCNIDRCQTGSGNEANSTICFTHFIDLTTNLPISGRYIEEQQFNPEVYKRLGDRLSQVGITLAKDGIGIGSGEQTSDSKESQLVVYILAGGLGFMGVVLIVVGTTCYFNNRGLSRRVRALTATTFGSQMSGLNRTGATLDLPNTNEFAIEGSNPMWTTNPPDGDRRTPAFDAESIGSGGSVLIGVEDDDDFRHYKGMENANPTAPGFDDYEDEDLYADPSENNGRRGGEIEDSESRSDTESEDNYQEEGSESGQGRDEPEFDLPPGFGATSTRRNPLLDMAYEEEDDRL